MLSKYWRKFTKALKYNWDWEHIIKYESYHYTSILKSDYAIQLLMNDKYAHYLNIDTCIDFHRAIFLGRISTITQDSIRIYATYYNNANAVMAVSFVNSSVQFLTLDIVKIFVSKLAKNYIHLPPIYKHDKRIIKLVIRPFDGLIFVKNTNALVKGIYWRSCINAQCDISMHFALGF